MNLIKYPRTVHLPFSPGKTDDDLSNDCHQFVGQEVVITVKMDGENTTGYPDGHTHARSVDSRGHVSRDWVKSYLAGKLTRNLPEGWRVCGENLFAKHSIHYTELTSYFLLFSIWDEENNCLSWDETVEWAELLEIPTVEVLYKGVWDETLVKNLAKQVEEDKENKIEGFVVRLASSFHYSEFSDSVSKFVRKNHVQTDQHWMHSSITPNQLKT